LAACLPAWQNDPIYTIGLPAKLGRMCESESPYFNGDYFGPFIFINEEINKG